MRPCFDGEVAHSDARAFATICLSFLLMFLISIVHRWRCVDGRVAIFEKADWFRSGESRAGIFDGSVCWEADAAVEQLGRRFAGPAGAGNTSRFSRPSADARPGRSREKHEGRRHARNT